MSNSDIQKLQTRLDRANAKVRILEKMIEDSTRDLYLENQRVKQAKEELSVVLNAMLNGLVALDVEGRVVLTNKAFLVLSGFEENEIIGMMYSKIVEVKVNKEVYSNNFQTSEARIKTKNSNLIEVLISDSKIESNDLALFNRVLVFHDLTEFKKLQIELQSAQKLESIGRLAAGIAHEINTPVQYIGDNTNFLISAINAFKVVILKLKATIHAKISSNNVDEDTLELNKLITDNDIDFYCSESRLALEQSLEGINRVSEIVQAMKEFSHPGGKSKELVDLNRLIENTIAICSGEWKYLCSVETQLDTDSSTVCCFPAEISQVILNMIINASHAISEKIEKYKDPQYSGKILIRTNFDDETAFIEIQDNGLGIQEEVISKIYDPFFTTKELGKGTGQGLALAWGVVVEQHGGALDVNSVLGIGTTFTIRLPRS